MPQWRSLSRLKSYATASSSLGVSGGAAIWGKGDALGNVSLNTNLTLLISGIGDLHVFRTVNIKLLTIVMMMWQNETVNHSKKAATYMKNSSLFSSESSITLGLYRIYLSQSFNNKSYLSKT